MRCEQLINQPLGEISTVLALFFDKQLVFNGNRSIPNSPPVVIQNKSKARKSQCLRAFLFLPFSKQDNSDKCTMIYNWIDCNF